MSANRLNIVFVSNYFNHHQVAFSEAMNNHSDINYIFIATSEMSQSRQQLGYNMGLTPPYVMKAHLSNDTWSLCKQIIDEADIVIAGSAPEELLLNRKKSGKLLLRYSERPLKRGIEIHKFLYRWIKWRRNDPLKSNHYMLCASAFTAADYARFGLFSDKCFKWGYFPETKEYADIDKLMSAKRKNTLLWAGRFLDWKHPDAVIRLAKRLKDSDLDFELNIIGTGEMEAQLKEMIASLNLTDCVHILGSMKPEQVREYMEQSQIYLFTSDRNEGWGAVLNESMNSGCAVVASHAIGSVPFLLKDNENGFIYESGNENELFLKVKYLLDAPSERDRMGKNAYQTIVTEWNAEIAAERFVQLSQHILAGEKSPDLFESGPCSKAKILRDTWYKSNQ